MKANFLKLIPTVLLMAGIYNIIWGIVFLFWLNMNQIHTSIYYLLGASIFSMGTVYLMASENPFKYHLFILAGIISKVLGVLCGFMLIAADMGIDTLINYLVGSDLVWLVLFTGVYYLVVKKSQALERAF